MGRRRDAISDHKLKPARQPDTEGVQEQVQNYCPAAMQPAQPRRPPEKCPCAHVRGESRQMPDAQDNPSRF